MAAILEELENQALRLSPQERGELIHRLIVSLEGKPAESSEDVAAAWDADIAHRVADVEAGHTQWISAEDAFARLDAIAKGEHP